MYDLIIKNGLVVSPKTTIKEDICIKDEIIKYIGKLKSTNSAKRIINADGKYVMPGVIDAHMHVLAPFQGCLGANDFYTQSISAAFGGVTTFIDFTNTFKGKSVFEAIKTRRKEMENSAIDFGIHGKFVEAPQNILDEIPKIVEYGCPSFKLFMTYKKEGVMSDDETLLKVFREAKKYNALPMVHAESNAIAELNNEEFEKDNKLDWCDFAKAKPILCEAEAASRAIYYSEYTGNALLIVHSTNGEVINSVKRAQEKGFPIYAETCPQYLVLSKSIYNDPNKGYLSICSPPLRTKKESEELWEGIKNGNISVTGSDDCTYSKKEKTMFLDRDKDDNIIPDYTKVVNGVPGIETRFPILLSEGVSKKRFSINKLCEITSTNIAKIFGCYPKKGILAEGSDADIVIVDPNKEVKLSADSLHNNIDYSLYENIKTKGFPIITISKGNVIVENGRFYGKKGDGQFIKRKIKKEFLEKFNLK
ncbi:dihydropyrimidinase [Clostridium tyrobutyricum]|uniref:dihydropyrimidinase n=1 Tax=Clostridium tyrobutyricum TaxID=1519 RepID=UPI001C384E48|nr:dihydropyrimidinase [Clostridium tyrobutyricum]MBV4427524.1 dihydropyrimidinase [Clostridium tyrobutyricum]MBV4442739.1 dihydropyrimidinase [Clostridium tyrobutyricum]